MDAGWLIIAAGLAGLLSGGIIVAAMHQPLRARADTLRTLNRQLEDRFKTFAVELADKKAESARYAAAIARITTSLASAKPEPGQPFYPHRLAAFREAVALVLDACREAM